MTLSINRAADVLLGGGIIAYPTEGVFGLGCMPDDQEALARLLEMKQRDPAKGLILIAAEPSQFRGWVADADLERLPTPDPEHPTTWIANAGPHVGPLGECHEYRKADYIFRHIPGGRAHSLRIADGRRGVE